MKLMDLLVDIENALTHPSAMALCDRAHDFNAKRTKALAALRILKYRARAGASCPTCGAEKIYGLCPRCDL